MKRSVICFEKDLFGLSFGEWVVIGKSKSRQTKIRRLLPVLKARTDGPGGSGTDGEELRALTVQVL